MKSNQLFWFSYFKFLFIFLCNLQGMHIQYFAYCKLEKSSFWCTYTVAHTSMHRLSSIVFSWKCLYMVKAISSVAVLQNMIWYVCKLQQFCYRFLKWYFSSGKFDLKRKQLIIFSYNIGIFTKGIARIIHFYVLFLISRTIIYHFSNIWIVWKLS